MTAGAATVPFQLASTRRMARFAGGFYVIAVATAVFAEFVAPGRMGIAAVVVPITCYTAVTLLLFVILRPVSQPVALGALIFGLVGLAFEALRWHPLGANIGMVSHGVFCLLIGYLLFRSTLVPRIVGQFMGGAGMMWLFYLDPPFARSLAPWNSFFGLLCEAIPMLWLLIAGAGAWRRSNLPVRRRR